MKTEDIVIIVLSTATFVVTLVSLRKLHTAKKEYHNQIRKLHRSEEVEVFRNKIAGLYGTKGLIALPDFEDMVEDTKELTTANYLDLSKVINQN